MHKSSETPDTILLENVGKIYHKPGTSIRVTALRGISIRIQSGEYVAIVGASGSGKTTMMNIIGCLDRPSSGTYSLAGQDISQLSDDALSDVRGKRIGFIFQSFNLIAQQTVLENLETPGFYVGVPAAERRRRALELAERVELTDRLDHKPMELSGGQQQRVSIARALMNNPVVLLADEPTGNLDSKTGQLILNLLDELNAAGMTIIVVTHDSSVAQRCGRIIELSDGLVASDT